MTKSVALEAATSGIRYNTVTPGFISTEMTEVLADEIKDGINVYFRNIILYFFYYKIRTSCNVGRSLNCKFN